MKVKDQGVLSWDIEEISKALKMTGEEVRKYFTDGRRVSFLMERRICREVLLGNLAPSEGAAYDLVGKDNLKWEVRSISRNGIYFCPSFMVGSGRKFDKKGFLAKLAEVEGYIVSDIESFPNVPYWVIAKDQVRNWYDSGVLGATTKIARGVALGLISQYISTKRKA